jgi:D-alanine-D-alanine ligase
MAMRIGVTYDLRADYLALGMSEEETAEFDSEVTIEAICDALAALGHRPDRIGGIRPLTQRLAAGERWDAVFNICEGLKGLAREAQVPALLEAYDIPYVFSDPLTLAIALDKSWAKRIVRDAGIATAPFTVIEKLEDVAAVDLGFPLFLKPVGEGSGKGVDEKSRVDNEQRLRATAADLLGRFDQPVLVESFLPGREFTVGITGTDAQAKILGICEIIPTGNFVGHGYGLVNKEEWEDKVQVVLVDDAEARAAGRVALEAWRALRCRDGGRIDIRADEQGRPNFIEVNPLAGLRPHYSDLCFIADYKGLAYKDLIGLFLESFLARHPHLRARAAAE